MVSIIQNEILAKLPAQECDEPPGEFLVITHKSVIASEAKQSPCRKTEIASSQKPLLAMTPRTHPDRI